MFGSFENEPASARKPWRPEPGIHRTYMGGVERGEHNICLKNIIRLAAALGAHPRDLFDESNQQ